MGRDHQYLLLFAMIQNNLDKKHRILNLFLISMILVYHVHFPLDILDIQPPPQSKHLQDHWL